MIVMYLSTLHSTYLYYLRWYSTFQSFIGFTQVWGRILGRTRRRADGQRISGKHHRTSRRGRTKTNDAVCNCGSPCITRRHPKESGDLWELIWRQATQNNYAWLVIARRMAWWINWLGGIKGFKRFISRGAGNICEGTQSRWWTSIRLVGAIRLTETKTHTAESQKQVLGKDAQVWYLYPEECEIGDGGNR